MSSKFWRRTLRNVVFPKRPYFAHLSVTHRCNLRCRFCQIPLERMEELDFDRMKLAVDCLDQLGIAVLSLTGGEPLLRTDCIDIVNYAARKGLFVKVSSNGTLPGRKYEELLKSRVAEIGISLDGIRGEGVPHMHNSTAIRANLRYMNDHLPPRKRLTINVTVYEGNRTEVQKIVDYCTREFPNARLWLNPVVVGHGKLRVQTQPKVNPEFMDNASSPTLLMPAFYRNACQTYYRQDNFNWDCRAGEVFFDIKPNGDFWLCQDQAAEPRLNIMSPTFKEDYRHLDFSNRRGCAGCTYSCYYVIQNAFKPGNWKEMSVLWWLTATHPQEPCRHTAATRGWFAGFLHLAWARFYERLRSECNGLDWLHRQKDFPTP